MVGVTTVALLERKQTISRDLFSRYWRDVHGVMAARIPGFHSYVQYHVTPVGDAVGKFEGIAVVGFSDETDRAGLATSDMTKYIHRDERNVFRRALLYNLGAGAMQVAADGAGEYQCFLVLADGLAVSDVASRVSSLRPTAFRHFDLRSGDPGAWNDTDVEDGAGRRFRSMMHAAWPTAVERDDAVAEIVRSGAAVYVVNDVHAMVLDGRATPLGLRGFDAIRTIREAGADNQFDREVEDAMYGIKAPRPAGA